ncbi:MAG TPA: hypothetical protein VK705_10105 [Ferruginibacter sp.]|jgi:hypothetical protein|nr:hypothetical protein [Ferruginibacter sp.]
MYNKDKNKEIIDGLIAAEKQKNKTYLSIRTVTAINKEEALKKIEAGDFDTSHPLCDKVATMQELKKLI